MTRAAAASVHLGVRLALLSFLLLASCGSDHSLITSARCRLDAYLAVHLRSAGTGDRYTSDEESAFTTFDGEPALVTTLHVLR